MKSLRFYLAPALLASTILAAGAAHATPFSVAAGVTDNTAKTVGGSDTGSVAATGTLSAATAITNNAAAAGVVITNDGTITGSTRGIDTSGGSTSRTITLNNNAGASLLGGNDAFRVNTNVASGVITVNNAGLIQSATGQALDFNAIAAGTATVTINNYATGVIKALDADAVRPGQAATVNNYGLIQANTTIGDNSDGVDWQDKAGTLHNFAGGVVSGARHGTTSDVNVNVINELGGLILGRNGSGVGSDGNGTVVNHGVITGAIDLTNSFTNGDGDGVDIDFQANIQNYGLIQGTGAFGIKDGQANKSEGIAAGGGTIVNYSGATIRGADNGILVDDGNDGAAHSATNLTNAGAIQGQNGYAVKFVGNFADTISNSGAIIAAAGFKAIDLGAGDDTLALATGSAITGASDGGDGVDTLDLSGQGSVTSDIINFEKLVLEGGSDWTLASLAIDAAGLDVVKTGAGEAHLFIQELTGLDILGDAITNIDSAVDIYYSRSNAANARLGGQTFSLAGGGRLIATPEPGVMAVFGLGLAGLLAARRRK